MDATHLKSYFLGLKPKKNFPLRSYHSTSNQIIGGLLFLIRNYYL